jgi:hypothetical protein
MKKMANGDRKLSGNRIEVLAAKVHFYCGKAVTLSRPTTSVVLTHRKTSLLSKHHDF